MALLGNYSVISKSPGRFMSGTTVSGDRANFNKSSNARNIYSNTVINKKNAVPNGYLPPASWVIPQKAGGMASYTALTSTGTFENSNLAGGINILADTLTGYLSVTSIGQLVASLTSTVTGHGILDLPTILGILQASSTVTASGLITNAALSLLAFKTANFTGVLAISEGDLTNASLLAVANLTGGIVTTLGELEANALMTADILPYTELSPQSLANAVWGKNLLDELDAGTYGKLLKQLKAMIAAGL